MILQIFSACASDSEPPNTVKSWANTATGATLDAAEPGEHAVARDALLLHPEVVAAVHHEAVHLLERARVEEEVETLAGGELAGRVLLGDPLLAAALEARRSELCKALADVLAHAWSPQVVRPCRKANYAITAAVMEHGDRSDLSELARRSRAPVLRAWWTCSSSAAPRCAGASRRVGWSRARRCCARVRRCAATGALVSGDGLDRPVLASLLGITTRALPPFSAPAFPDPPRLEEVLADLSPGRGRRVRWGWRWAAVIATAAARSSSCAPTSRGHAADGQRAAHRLAPVPGAEPDGAAPEQHANARVGKARVLLAPAAAAVLLHELIGHPLEGDLLLRGASPWSGTTG